MVPVDLWLGCGEKRATENVKGLIDSLTDALVAPQWEGF